MKRLRWPASMATVAVVLACGLAASWTAGQAVDRQRQAHLADAMDQRVQAVQHAVAAEARRYSDTVADLATAAGAQSELTAADFAAITSRTSRDRLSGASGVIMVVPAADGQISSVQADWRARGNGHLILQPVGAGNEHLFVVLSRPLDGATPVHGLDLSAAAEPIEALNLARTSGQVTASRTYVLLKDRTLPAGQQQLSFLLAAPVHGGPSTPDAGRFRGWILMGMRGGDFITETLHQASQGAVDVTLTDLATPGAPTVANANSGNTGAGFLQRTTTVTVGERTWQLTIRPTTAMLHSARGSSAHTVAMVGAAFTLLLATLVLTLVTSRNRALASVDKATAALRVDITVREATEAQLRERTAELEAFAGVAAHDLRSPLTALAGYTEILHDDYATRLDDAGRRHLQRMADATTRMRTLIDELLAYAAAGNASVNIQPVDLDRLVTDILTERVAGLTNPPHIDVGPLPTVAADPLLLRQVLDNLIGNAIKYVRPGRTPYVAVTAGPDPAGWRIDVTDRGIGFGSDEHETIFGAFHRARGSEGYQGTGLGLAICKRIIDRHGTTIGVQSNPDGSSFWFTIPTAADITATAGRSTANELQPSH